MANKKFVRRSYPMPSEVYEEMRDINEAKKIPMSDIMGAAFKWWLERVANDRGYLVAFMASLPRYAKKYKRSEKRRVYVKLSVGQATLLDIFSRNFNVGHAALLYAIFEEYHTSLIEELALGESEKNEKNEPETKIDVNEIIENLDGYRKAVFLARLDQLMRAQKYSLKYLKEEGLF